ncbi:hypothetical protein KSS87_000555, partial [Heliosperma pusillum]
ITTLTSIQKTRIISVSCLHQKQLQKRDDEVHTINTDGFLICLKRISTCCSAANMTVLNLKQ